MERLFLSVYHMSISAGYLIAAVMAARFVLKKAPRNIICLLWLIAGLRLICPFHIETAFSLLPDRDSIAFTSQTRHLPDNGTATPEVLTPTGRHTTAAAQIQDPVLPEETKESGSFDLLHVCTCIWLAGIFLLWTYLVFHWYRISRRTAAAVPDTYEGIKFYWCDEITSPFLFGLAPPKIYVPFSFVSMEIRYVLKHEQAHKSRYDHLLKLGGYLLLAVYWFHPLVWAAYILFCRDLELACDEKVIRELGSGYKQAYAASLLTCSVNRKITAASTVAFGEIGVKKRVKNILEYKKPKFRVFLAAAFVCAAVTVCFATETKSEDKKGSADTKNAAAGTESPGNAKQASTDTVPLDDSQKILIQKHLHTWAEAFCGRDKAALEQMLKDDSAKKAFFGESDPASDSHSFGWSSPWPWAADTDTAMKNYQLLYTEADSAVILYYAWTSDPHVTVWYQKLEFQYDSRTDQLYMNPSGTSTQFLDDITSSAEFYNAYILGGIAETPIDYLSNGTGRALNRNAKNNKKDYKMLFQPDAAAVYLLNISSDTSKVTAETVKQNGAVYVTFTFLEDNRRVNVKMIQPYGAKGIWIPAAVMPGN